MLQIAELAGILTRNFVSARQALDRFAACAGASPLVNQPGLDLIVGRGLFLLSDHLYAASLLGTVFEICICLMEILMGHVRELILLLGRGGEIIARSLHDVGPIKLLERSVLLVHRDDLTTLVDLLGVGGGLLDYCCDVSALNTVNHLI